MSKLSAGLRAVKQVGVKTKTSMTSPGPGGRVSFRTVSGRNDNAFYRPKKTVTLSSNNVDGGEFRTSSLSRPGSLTPLGRATRNGAVAGGAAGTGAGVLYADRKKKVSKMALPGKRPIGYLTPKSFPDATGQRGPTGGKRKGDQKDISKSIWGVDHAEPVHKGLTDRPGFKATVFNKDALKKSPGSSKNRELLGRHVSEGVARGGAKGFGAGLIGGTAAGVAAGKGNPRTTLTGAALGAAGGTLAGQGIGGYKGSLKAQRSKGYTAR